MINAVLFFGLILVALIIGTKWKINIGLIAAGFAFLLGTAAGKMSAGSIVSLFPTTLFFNFFTATFLFGFAGCNGTLKKFAQHCLYKCRNTGWMLGILFFLVTVLVAALGASGSSAFFMSAICFSLAFQAKINPLLVSVAVWTGSMVGGGFPWTSSYATNIGQLEIYFPLEEATRFVNKFYLWRAVFYTGIYFVTFLFLKGYRAGNQTEIEKPEPFDKDQKRTLIIILSIILVITGAAMIQSLFPGERSEIFAELCSFQMLSLTGIVFNIAGKTAPYERVLKDYVPWDTLIMLSLTGMYMALAEKLGVIELMSEILQDKVPAVWILPGIVASMCVLSFFVSGRVVIPMMLPLMKVFAAASGVSVTAIYCATQIGLTASSISPFSQGGAAALSGCSDEKVRKEMVRQQTVLAGIFTVLIVIVSAAGGFSMLY